MKRMQEDVQAKAIRAFAVGGGGYWKLRVEEMEALSVFLEARERRDDRRDGLMRMRKHAAASNHLKCSV